MKNQWLTIPNILSAYRLVSFPFLAWLCYTGHEQLFAILLIINLITDVLDGLIARVFNQQSDIGARLDSMADIGSYILAIWGLFAFKWDIISHYLFSFTLFLCLYAATLIFSFLKFGRFTSFHLYSSKIGGYLQGGLFIMIFSNWFIPAYYYLAIGWGILSFLEHLSLQAMLPELRSNLKGIYWVLKSRQGE